MVELPRVDAPSQRQRRWLIRQHQCKSPSLVSFVCAVQDQRGTVVRPSRFSKPTPFRTIVGLSSRQRERDGDSSMRGNQQKYGYSSWSCLLFRKRGQGPVNQWAWRRGIVPWRHNVVEGALPFHASPVVLLFGHGSHRRRSATRPAPVRVPIHEPGDRQHLSYARYQGRGGIRLGQVVDPDWRFGVMGAVRRNGRGVHPAARESDSEPRPELSHRRLSWKAIRRS